MKINTNKYKFNFKIALRLTLISVVIILAFIVSYFTLYENSSSQTISAADLKSAELNSYPVFRIQPLSGKLAVSFYKKHYNSVIKIASKIDKLKSHELYVVAISYYKLRKYSKALEYFEDYLKTDPAISDYIYYYLGKINYGKKKYSKANEYLTKLRNEYPDSRMLGDSIDYEARTYLVLREYTKLIEEYDKSLDNDIIKKSDIDIKARLLYYKAIALERLKRYKEAKEIYFDILNEEYTNYSSYSMNNILDMVKKDYKQLSFKENILIAKTYLNKKSRKSSVRESFRDKALEILDSIKEDYENQTDKDKAIYCYYLAEYYSLKRKYDDVIKYYNRYLDLKPDNNAFIHDAEYNLAVAYSKSDKAKAMKMYKKIAENKEHEYYRESLEYLCSQLMFSNNPDEKEEVKNYIHLLVKNHELRQVNSIWKIFLKKLNNKEYRFILDKYPEIVEAMPGSEIKARLYYWLGEVALYQYRNEDARKYFEESFLCFGYNYYSLHSLKRLSEYKVILLSDVERIKKKYKLNRELYLKSNLYKNWSKNQYKTWSVKHLSSSRIKRMMNFFQVGEIRLGDLELRQYLREIEEERYLLYPLLARFYYKSALPQFAIRYVQLWINIINVDNESRFIPDEWINLYFPKPFFVTVNRYSKEYKVDPLYIYAIMREESRFYTKAISYVGAMGLMQIMPYTAKGIAKQIGVKNYNLFDFEDSIRFGSKYVSGLLSDIRDKHKALAGYNAGPGAVRKWERRYGKKIINVVHFSELIPYTETRKYVTRVMGSYYGYLFVNDKL